MRGIKRFQILNKAEAEILPVNGAEVDFGYTKVSRKVLPHHARPPAKGIDLSPLLLFMVVITISLPRKEAEKELQQSVPVEGIGGCCRVCVSIGAGSRIESLFTRG